MASDLQKKSKHTTEARKPPVTDQTTDPNQANSGSSPFTVEQRQILGNVYRLILGWRRERLMKSKPQIALPSSSIAPIEREA